MCGICGEIRFDGHSTKTQRSTLTTAVVTAPPVTLSLLSVRVHHMSTTVLPRHILRPAEEPVRLFTTDLAFCLTDHCGQRW